VKANFGELILEELKEERKEVLGCSFPPKKRGNAT
jgi:hypothetical protein